MKSKTSPALDLVRTCCRVLDDKKAAALTVLDVSAQSSITDFLVLATATSDPHLRAMRIELEKTLDAAKVHVVGIERAHDSGWLIIDAFDVMIHLFLAETRERYGLERLWRDATEISLKSLSREAATRQPRKSSRRAASKRPKARRPRG